MILILVGCMSFFYTYEEKAYFISLQQDIPEDVNPERLAKILKIKMELSLICTFYCNRIFSKSILL